MDHQTEQIKQWKRDYIRREGWRKFKFISMSICYSFMIICFAGILFCANQQKTTSEIVIDYARPTYTVSFDANGGTNTASKQVKLGDNYGTLPTTSRTGYTFSGWNGKNLVNIPNGNYGSYISVSNNVITVKKSTVSSTTTVFSALQLKPNTTYTVSCKIQGSFTGRIYAFLMRNGDSMASIYSNYLDSQGNFTCTYTTSDTGIDTDKGNITITQGSGTNSDLNMTSDQIVISNIMLCEGGSVPYEPYYVTSTTMNTTVGNHTLTARWTPKTYSIKLYENKNILYGGELTETQDLLAWEGSSYASIATEDGLSCAKISGALSTTKYVRQSILDRCQFNTGYIISAKAKVVNYVAGSTDPYLALYLDGSYNNNGKSTWYGFGGTTSISGYSGKGWQNIFSHFTSNSTATSSTATSAAVYLYARDFTGDVFFRDYSLALATNASKSVTYDSAIAPVSALSRTGYTFQGYFTQPVGGTKIFNANGSVVKNVSGYTDSNGNWVRDEAINLYGQWKANSYTVTLDKQGGSGGTSSLTAKYNSKPVSISAPTKTGYTFGGYYTKMAGSGKGYFNASGNTTSIFTEASNTTLYAKWTANTYTITFNKQGGSGGVDSATATYDSTVPNITSVPTKTGYVFGGYYTKTNGEGTQYYNSSGVGQATWTTAGGTTLYAKWTPITYEIKYNGNGNTGGSMSNSSHTYDVAKNLTTNGFTKTGYSFVGWATSSTGSKVYDDGASVKNLSSTNGATVNLYALWTAITYTVGYNGNGNTGGSTGASTHYYDTERALTSNGFTKTGYTFAGWATSASGSVVYSDGAKVLNLASEQGATVILYAKWTANTIKITLSPAASSLSNIYYKFDTEKYYSDSNLATQITTVPVVQKTGYTYDGYYSGTSGSGVQYIDASGNIKNSLYSAVSAGKTLYANYIPNKYTLTFDKQGGSGGTSSISATYNATVPNITAPTKTGYIFGGYYSAENGSGTQYYNSSGVGQTTWTTASGATLYAKWTPITYEIKYNGNGNTGGSMSNSSHTYDTAKALTTNGFTKTGYNFAGWATTSTGSKAYDNGASVKNLSSTNGATVTLYALWTAKTYSVSTGSNYSGVTVSVTPSERKFDSEITVGTTAELDGYTYTFTNIKIYSGTDTSGTLLTTITTSSGKFKMTGTYYSSIYVYATWARTAKTYSVTSGHTDLPGVSVTVNSKGTFDSNLAISSSGSATGYTYTISHIKVYSGSNTSGTLLATISATSGNFKMTGTYYSSVYVYATWTRAPITYTVGYNGNGNTGGSTASSSHTYDTAKALTSNGFTKTGYSFAGWATSASGSVVYSDEENVLNLASGQGATVILYAKWTANSYTLTYALNGGTLDGKSGNATATVKTDESVAFGIPTRTGYIFNGWTFSGGTVTSGTESNAYAYGTAKVAKPSFAGGTNPTYVYNNSANGTVTHSIVSGSAPNNTGYYLEITNTGSASPGLGGFYFGHSTSANMVLTSVIIAKIPVGYSIGFYTNNTGDGSSGSWITSTAGTGTWQKYIYRRNCGSSGTFSSTNFYAISGTAGTTSNPVKWQVAYAQVYDSTGATASTLNTAKFLTFTGATNITATANWTPITYTVSYNGNGNTGGSTANSSHTYDTAKALTSNGFTKTGYSFAGWATSSGGSVAYSNGASVTNLSSTNGATVTLYAKWTINTYTLKIDPNGGYRVSDGSTSVISVTKNYNSTETISARARTGYTLTGWKIKNTSSNSESDIGGASVTTLDSNKEATFTQGTVAVTLVAQWTPITYTVSYNGNGNTGGSTGNSSHTYDVAKALTSNGFTKTGYNFAGWATSSGGSVVYSNGASVKNLSSTNGATVTLYAKWTIKTIKITLNKNGGTGGTDVFYYKYGTNTFYTDYSCSTTLSKPSLPTRTGYTFVHYYGDGTCGGNNGERYAGYADVNYGFASDLCTDIYQDATLYASWSANTYTLTINYTVPKCASCLASGKVTCSSCNGAGGGSETCSSCGGSGQYAVTCSQCGGSGTLSGGNRECTSCSGSGISGYKDCSWCGGSGSDSWTCGTCGGSGDVGCGTCRGSGSNFSGGSQSLTVTYGATLPNFTCKTFTGYNTSISGYSISGSTATGTGTYTTAGNSTRSATLNAKSYTMTLNSSNGSWSGTATGTTSIAFGTSVSLKFTNSTSYKNKNTKISGYQSASGSSSASVSFVMPAQAITLSGSGSGNNNCLAYDTPILTSNGWKMIQDITYSDRLIVMNHDTGKIDSAYATWISKGRLSSNVMEVTFSNGEKIRFVGDHAVFSLDYNRYIVVTDPAKFHIGSRVLKLLSDNCSCGTTCTNPQHCSWGEATVTNIRYVDEEVLAYSVISSGMWNCFAGNILTTVPNTLTFQNMYGFRKDLTYASSIRKLVLNGQYEDHLYTEQQLRDMGFEDRDIAGFRGREWKILVDNGMITEDIMINDILLGVVNNPDERVLPPTDENGNLVFVVTTSQDVLSPTFDIQDNYYEEYSQYILPNLEQEGFVGWRCSVDGKIYSAGDIYIVRTGTHFEEVFADG